jgi:hypothetical protein
VAAAVSDTSSQLGNTDAEGLRRHGCIDHFDILSARAATASRQPAVQRDHAVCLRFRDCALLSAHLCVLFSAVIWIAPGARIHQPELG